MESSFRGSPGVATDACGPVALSIGREEFDRPGTGVRVGQIGHSCRLRVTAESRSIRAGRTGPTVLLIARAKNANRRAAIHGIHWGDWGSPIGEPATGQHENGEEDGDAWPHVGRLKRPGRRAREATADHREARGTAMRDRTWGGWDSPASDREADGSSARGERRCVTARGAADTTWLVSSEIQAGQRERPKGEEDGDARPYLGRLRWPQRRRQDR